MYIHLHKKLRTSRILLNFHSSVAIPLGIDNFTFVMQSYT